MCVWFGTCFLFTIGFIKTWFQSNLRGNSLVKILWKISTQRKIEATPSRGDSHFFYTHEKFTCFAEANHEIPTLKWNSWSRHGAINKMLVFDSHQSQESIFFEFQNRFHGKNFWMMINPWIKMVKLVKTNLSKKNGSWTSWASQKRGFGDVGDVFSWIFVMGFITMFHHHLGE